MSEIEVSDIHSRLREARMKAGFSSASKAAEKLGFPVSTYISHENGGRGYKPDQAIHYAAAFGVSRDWLLFGDGEAQSNGVAANSLLRPDWRDIVNEAIHKSGLAKRDISDRAGLGINYISQMLNDGKVPSIDRLTRICGVLSLPISSVINDPGTADRVRRAVVAAFAAVEAMGMPANAENVSEAASRLYDLDDH